MLERLAALDPEDADARGYISTKPGKSSVRRLRLKTTTVPMNCFPKQRKPKIEACGGQRTITSEFIRWP
jgi:ribosomal protein L25 (general stress protein Ctc)